MHTWLQMSNTKPSQSRFSGMLSSHKIYRIMQNNQELAEHHSATKPMLQVRCFHSIRPLATKLPYTRAHINSYQTPTAERWQNVSLLQKLMHQARSVNRISPVVTKSQETKACEMFCPIKLKDHAKCVNSHQTSTVQS